MSLRDFPQELVSHIITFLTLQHARLAPYAGISSTWQHAVEAHTFSRLNILTADLDDFHQHIAASNASTHRRAALRVVEFTPVLPTYSDDVCARFETDADRQRNSASFSDSVSCLFSSLALCNNIEKPRPISLRLHTPYSPMDVSHRGSDKYTRDKRDFDFGIREDLWQRRYEHSYLRLLDPKELPVLQRVKSFEVFASVPRYVQPAAIAEIARRLPNLETARWQLWDGERKFPELRTQLRREFATALGSLDLPQLRSIHLLLQHENPFDEDFINADVRYDDEGDRLSTSLGTFLRSQQNITKITLDGPICISAALFHDTGEQSVWLNVQELFLSFSAVRPDGGWYFDRDPEAPTSDEDDNVGLEYQNSKLNDDDEESGSDYDANEPFFSEPTDLDRPSDSYNARKEARLNGTAPTRIFRSLPNSATTHLLEAMARSIQFMPRLKTFSAGADIQPCARTKYDPQNFGIEYAAKGVANWKDEGVEDRERARLHWTVPRGWRMGGELEGLWRSVLGEEGVVRYEEW